MRLKNRKKIVVLSLALVALLVTGLSFILLQRSSSSVEIPEGIAGRSDIDYSPPTEQEKAAGDAQKDKTIKQQELDSEQTQHSQANVVITDASYYPNDNSVEVRGYISNIFEDGGTCTATFTQGSQTISKTSQAFKDASSTQCGAINVSRGEFPAAGTWNIKLSYQSSTAHGEQVATVKL